MKLPEITDFGEDEEFAYVLIANPNDGKSYKVSYVTKDCCYGFKVCIMECAPELLDVYRRSQLADAIYVFEA